MVKFFLLNFINMFMLHKQRYENSIFGLNYNRWRRKDSWNIRLRRRLKNVKYCQMIYYFEI